MATKKREIYARAAVQLRTHTRAIKAEKKCPGAMGLYLFLLLDSRGEQTAGDVDEDVAMSSWGAPESYRRRQAEALIAVGLVERVDGRLVVVKYDEHNDTPTDIAEARERARLKKQSQRRPDSVPGDNQGTPPICPPKVPISSSISTSGSDLSRESSRGARRFEPGTAAAIEALEVYQSSVTDAIGGTFVLPRAPFHGRDLCVLLDAHAPDGGPLESLAWLRKTIAAWVSVTDRKYAGGFVPSKLLDWLNEGRPDRSERKSAAEITKQPFDPDAPWIKLGDTGS